MSVLRKMSAKRQGVTIVEYGLIAALTAAMVALAIPMVSGAVGAGSDVVVADRGAVPIAVK